MRITLGKFKNSKLKKEFDSLLAQKNQTVEKGVESIVVPKQEGLITNSPSLPEKMDQKSSSIVKDASLGNVKKTTNRTISLPPSPLPKKEPVIKSVKQGYPVSERGIDGLRERLTQSTLKVMQKNGVSSSSYKQLKKMFGTVE